MKKIRLTESDLMKIVKRVIIESENKRVTVKELKKNGYYVESGDIPLAGHEKENLIDKDLKVVEQRELFAKSQLITLLKQNGIDPNLRSKGFFVLRKLDNGNVEYKWITIE